MRGSPVVVSLPIAPSTGLVGRRPTWSGFRAAWDSVVQTTPTWPPGELGFFANPTQERRVRLLVVAERVQTPARPGVARSTRLTSGRILPP
jgi:hypothetical protein